MTSKIKKLRFLSAEKAQSVTTRATYRWYLRPIKNSRTVTVSQNASKEQTNRRRSSGSSTMPSYFLRRSSTLSLIAAKNTIWKNQISASFHKLCKKTSTKIKVRVWSQCKKPTRLVHLMSMYFTRVNRYRTSMNPTQQRIQIRQD